MAQSPRKETEFEKDLESRIKREKIGISYYDKLGNDILHYIESSSQSDDTDLVLLRQLRKVRQKRRYHKSSLQKYDSTLQKFRKGKDISSSIGENLPRYVPRVASYETIINNGAPLMQGEHE